MPKLLEAINNVIENDGSLIILIETNDGCIFKAKTVPMICREKSGFIYLYDEDMDPTVINCKNVDLSDDDWCAVCYADGYTVYIDWEESHS